MTQGSVQDGVRDAKAYRSLHFGDERADLGDEAFLLGEDEESHRSDDLKSQSVSCLPGFLVIQNELREPSLHRERDGFALARPKLSFQEFDEGDVLDLLDGDEARPRAGAASRRGVKHLGINGCGDDDCTEKALQDV